MGRKQRPLEPGPLARAGRSVDKKAGTEPYSLCKSALLERVADHLFIAAPQSALPG
jgi:hypothetical protein